MKGLHTKPKRKGRDRRGVSEILANVLILGITVTLFTGVLAFVGNVPEPDDPVRVDMRASLDDDLLRIKHSGGSTLPDDDELTRIKIEADGTTRFVPLSSGITSDGSQWSGPWSAGSSWYFNFSANAELFDEDDPYLPGEVNVGITYIDQTNIIWSTTLRAATDHPPEIRSFKVEGENSGDGKIARGDLVTFTVRVTDKDDDIQTVQGDFNSLFQSGGPGIVQLTGGPEIFTIQFEPNADDGTYEVTITATDEEGNQDSERYQLTIFTPEDLEDPDPVDPPEPPPSDPTVPGGGNPEESPPDFFQEDVRYDFFAYSAADWGEFKTLVLSGAEPPNMTDRRSFDVGQQFYLIFKIDISQDGAHRNSVAASIEYHDPKDPWGIVRPTETGATLFTNAVELEDNQGRTILYMERLITFTSAMAANGVKIAAEVRTGPSVASGNAIDWHGHVTLNENGSPKVATSSSNLSAKTLYFKPEDGNIRIHVSIDDAVDKSPLVWSNSVFSPAKVYMTKDSGRNQPVDIPGGDISVIKVDDTEFMLQFSKSQIVNSLPLEPEWNAVHIEIPWFAIEDENNDWHHYRFAHKIYIEI